VEGRATISSLLLDVCSFFDGSPSFLTGFFSSTHLSKASNSSLSESLKKTR